MICFDAHTHWTAGTRPDGGEEPQTWLTGWDRYGVTHGIVMPLQSLSNDFRIRQENDDLSAVCARSGGRMIPFCTVNPALGADALAEFRRCLETLHFRGLKLHPWLQGVSPSSREVGELCELAGQLGRCFVPRRDALFFAAVADGVVARRHPKTTIILGHCGLFEHWREAISAMRYSENLWGCLCGPHLAALRELVVRCDIDRLLWGSDFGFGPADHIAYRKRLFELLELSDKQREAILSRIPRGCLTLQAQWNSPHNQADYSCLD